jgi:ABC-2 type transport system ATP-binding protein
LAQPVLAIETKGLQKSYGSTPALASLDLSITAGQFFGLLGRNGSGKTTTLHILSTLIRPTAGEAWVAGFDVTRQPVEVRRTIGLVFQESALDRSLSVEENLLFAGALYNLPKALIRERSDELLNLFELSGKRRAPVASLSGGMRRALDIARGVLHRPQVLLLDEPTIGLDVINRRAIWRFLNRLREEQGTTLVLTTHYLEEAVACHQVTFLKEGEVIGEGVPQALIKRLGYYILDIETDNPNSCVNHLTPFLGKPIIEGNHLLFRVTQEDFPLQELQRELRAHVRAMLLRQPDLNDVYVWLNHSG